MDALCHLPLLVVWAESNQGATRGGGDNYRGRNVTNIRYADDTVFVADSEEKLQRLVDTLYGGCERFGLTINTGKEKTETIPGNKQR